MRGLQADFEVKEGKGPVATAVDRGFVGFHYLSSDTRSIAQFRLDGFTYNRLSPYTNGDELLAEALRLWEVFVRIAAPAGVSRVALRYINHLSLPASRPLHEFLDPPPSAPKGAGGVVKSFLNRVECYDSESGLTVVKTIASTAAGGAAETGVIIDIDAFRAIDMGLEVAELRSVLDRLRVLKNRVFFGSITNQTVELLK